jgi:hypothetical protein
MRARGLPPVRVDPVDPLAVACRNHDVVPHARVADHDPGRCDLEAVSFSAGTGTRRDGGPTSVDGPSRRGAHMEERASGTNDQIVSGTPGDMDDRVDREVGMVEVQDGDFEEAPLFDRDRNASYRERWDDIQARFVDDPRRAVQEADELVSMVIGELESSFRDRRETLEAGWQQGQEASTEDLRITLQAYRSFFGRLLKI